jgi:hypothetical protein
VDPKRPVAPLNRSRLLASAVACQCSSPHDGRNKNVTEEARERLTFEVFQRQKMAAQKENDC